MKHIFLFIIIFALSCILPVKAEELPDIQLDMRLYDGVEVPAGVVISAINMQEISTETCPEGFKVKLLASNDLFIEETKVIPESTAFYGYIEKINEPIVGTNASMKVKITKMVYSDGFEIPIVGYIYTSNSNLIGGELTQPSEWVKKPHYQDKFQKTAWNYRGPTLQIRPGGKRSMGRHIRVPAGDRVLIILTAPLTVTHIVSE
ncbi:hypothetical protein J6G99_05300 [bacterium]|nr:hypothetical protein [bacterium]